MVDPEHVAAVRAYNRAAQSYNALGRALVTATGVARERLLVEFARAKALVDEASKNPRLSK